MKIVFALGNLWAFAFYDSLVRKLVERGHQVDVWHGVSSKACFTRSALDRCIADTGLSKTRGLRQPSRLRRAISNNLRILLNCILYRQPAHSASWLGKRQESYLNQPLRLLVKTPGFRQLLLSETAGALLRRLEKILPPDAEVEKELLASGADLVFVSPLIYINTSDIEYAKAAKALGLPLFACVQSWDNLSTKGCFHIMPDWIFVWNEALKSEAVKIHGIPSDRIVVTGAPRFDGWLSRKPSKGRDEFLRELNVKGSRYALYLCSSNFISGNETEFVKSFAKALADNESTKDMFVMVRPYPSNSEIWKDVDVPNMKVWPERGELPDAPEAEKRFYDSVSYCECAVGVNTTAFLEAAMAGRPCVAIMEETYKRTQSEMAHFAHLLAGDFIETAPSFKSAAAICGEIAKGVDAKKANREKFVKDFIRPCGMDRPAGEVMADALEALSGARKKAGV